MGSVRLSDDASSRDATLSIEPSLDAQVGELSRWRATASAAPIGGEALGALRHASRAALGLPTDVPLVLCGHQAGIWHAGIVAKWFVADEIARRAGGAAVQLIVDEDVNDAAAVGYPAMRDGSLVAVQLPVTTAQVAGPTGLRPTVELGEPVDEPVAEAREGLARIRSCMNAARSAPSLAAQTALATDALLEGTVAPMRALFATQLLATPIGEALLRRMRRDPEGCAAAYDSALAADPRVARPLERDELPLWKLTAGSSERVRARANDLASGNPAALAPRAFLMTAIARLALCDLFVHGTGAARYERVTEAWIRAWLGVNLAPMSVATATLRLPLSKYVPHGATLTSTELHRLRWDPDADGRGPSEAKSAWLRRIASAPRRSRERVEAYRGMTTYIRERREAHAPKFARADELVASTRHAAAALELARSRAWPWPLHGMEAMETLRRSVA